MSTVDTSEVAINQLLIEREGVYARIHAIEQSINRLLGEATYPFPPPEVVPLSQRSNKQKKPSLRKQSLKKPLKVRRLENSEVAYELTYKTIDSIEKTAQFMDHRLLLQSLETLEKNTTITSIKTLGIDNLVIADVYSISPDN